MSYRSQGDLNVGAAVSSKVISNIPIVGGILSTLLGFTSIWDDYSVQIAAWQRAMQREYQLGALQSPQARRAAFLQSRRSIRSRFGAGP